MPIGIDHRMVESRADLGYRAMASSHRRSPLDRRLRSRSYVVGVTRDFPPGGRSNAINAKATTRAADPNTKITG